MVSDDPRTPKQPVQEIELIESSEEEELADSDPEVYEVAEILNKRFSGGVRQYLIRWKGYDETHDTWEPEDGLGDCTQKVSEFEAKQRAKEAPRRTSSSTSSTSKQSKREKQPSIPSTKITPADSEDEDTPSRANGKSSSKAKPVEEKSRVPKPPKKPKVTKRRTVIKTVIQGQQEVVSSEDDLRKFGIVLQVTGVGQTDDDSLLCRLEMDNSAEPIVADYEIVKKLYPQEMIKFFQQSIEFRP